MFLFLVLFTGCALVDNSDCLKFVLVFGILIDMEADWSPFGRKQQSVGLSLLISLNIFINASDNY